jgi:plasmid stability protein
MRQITVRGIPDDLQREIQSRAQAHGESLNKSVIRLLKQAVGLDRPEKKKRDLSTLAGKWEAGEAEEFERNVRVFETIDEDLWQ